MKIMQRKKLLYIILILLSYLVVLLIGSYLGSTAIRNQCYKIQHFNKFAQYESSREIAKALKASNYILAKCHADLDASDGYDFVKSCMNNKSCSADIAEEVQKRTPEILSNQSLGFDYLKRKNDSRHCD